MKGKKKNKCSIFPPFNPELVEMGCTQQWTLHAHKHNMAVVISSIMFIPKVLALLLLHYRS